MRRFIQGLVASAALTMGVVGAIYRYQASQGPRDQHELRRNLQLNTGMVSGPWLCAGMHCDECSSLIMAEAPDVTPFIAKPGTPVTREYNIHRAIVYTDDECIVTNNPNRG